MTTVDCLIKAKAPQDVLKRAKELEGQPEALREFMVDMQKDVGIRRRQTILTESIRGQMQRYINQFDVTDMEGAFNDMMSGMGAVQKRKIRPDVDALPRASSLENDIVAITGRAHKELADMLEALRPYQRMKSNVVSKISGKEKATAKLQADIVSEIFVPGSTRNNAAITFAKQWSKVVDGLVDRFNRAGGNITKMKTWNLPMSHDGVRMANIVKGDVSASRKIWVQQIQKYINLEEIDKLIPKGKEGKITRESILEDIYNSITSDGFSKIDDKKLLNPRAVSVGNRHQESRYLHFNSADDFMAYNKAYGSEEYYDSMMGYIELMGRDIAAMEKFGPTPDAMVSYLRGQVQKATGGTEAAGRLAENSYKSIMGKLHGSRNRLGEISSGLRNFETFALLGSAPMAATSDMVFSVATAIVNDVPAFRTLMRTIRELPTAGKQGRQTATALGLHTEYAINQASSANRMSDVTGYGTLAKMANVSVRLSGLQTWTQVAKQSFTLEFLAELGRRASKQLEVEDFSKAGQLSFERYGISPSDWKTAKQHTSTIHGVEYLDPTKMPPDISAKMVGLVREELRFAVPETNAKTHALLTGGTVSGTAVGEAARFGMQFKTFPTFIMTSHMMRAFDMGFSKGGAYAGGLLAGTTALGMVVVNAKEVASGKTPSDWNADLMMRGFIQGGSTGILGDLLMNDPRKYGGLPSVLVGPVIGRTTNILKFMWGTKDDMMDVTMSISEAAKKAGINMTASALDTLHMNLWYAKLAYKRMMTDGMREIADPTIHSKRMQTRRTMLQDKGQDFYWAPGDRSPQF